MKIVFDFQTFLDQQYGGVSRYFAEIYKGLSKYNDCEISTPVLFSKNEYLNDCGLKRNLPNRRLIFNKYTNKVYYRMNICYTEKFIKKNDIDIVHYTWNNDYLKNRDVKKIVTIHDMIHELGLHGEFAEKEIENKKRVIYESDAIIAISENTKRDILKIYPNIPSDKISVIYHGANLLPDPHNGKIYNVPKRYLLYVGYRHLYKNAKNMLIELQDLLREDQSLYLYFAGGRKFTEEEERLLNNLGIREKVIQNDVPDHELAYLYQNAICFVYPSLYEGFGLPPLEALVLGTKPIISDIDVFKEVYTNLPVEFFKVNDSESLKDKILNTSPKLPLINYEEINEKFNSKKFAAKIEEKFI